MQHVEFVEVQEEERGGFEIEVRLPRSTTLEEAEPITAESVGVVELILMEAEVDGEKLSREEILEIYRGHIDAMYEKLPELFGRLVRTMNRRRRNATTAPGAQQQIPLIHSTLSALKTGSCGSRV